LITNQYTIANVGPTVYVSEDAVCHPDL